jgi:stage III sporulation protein AG
MWLLLGATLLGVLLILAGNAMRETQTAEQAPAQEQQGSPGRAAEPVVSLMTSQEEFLAEKVRDMLVMVEGAGEVQVAVRLSSSTRSSYAVNATTGRKTTEERDQGGGTRVISEESDSGQLVLLRGTGSENPVMEQESAADIAGVLVVARGAADPGVKARLFRAVETGLGVEPHKILVLPMEGSDQKR